MSWFGTHPHADLLLADIELVYGRLVVKCPVIFTTTYNEYALKAFQVHSVDYLHKPINEAALRRSLIEFVDMQRVYVAARRPPTCTTCWLHKSPG